jgi:hypothetical protein
MMTPLDRDLAERLERLAAAVPVRPGQLDPVHAGAVAARRQLRMRWLTPLVVLLLVLLMAALAAPGALPHFRLDPVTTADGDSTTGAPPAATVIDGDFSLTLQAGKRNYKPNEPIDVFGSLNYSGDRDLLQIDTDSDGPIGFGIREKVFGEISVGGVTRLMCGQTILTRGEPLVEAFKKSGGFSGDHPEAERLRAFFDGKELRLPEGTWHLWATASAPCMGTGPSFQLRTEIEIVVDDDPNATPGQPVATDWNDKPVYGGDDNGFLGLQLKSLHPRYDEGTPIDLDVFFSFADGPAEVKRPFIPEVEYRITQSDPGAVDVRSADLPLDCTTTSLAPGEERHVTIDERNVVLVKAVDWPASAEQGLRRGELLLPRGHWRITVTVRALFGPCGAPTETWEVHASVEIDVLPRS